MRRLHANTHMFSRYFVDRIKYQVMLQLSTIKNMLRNLLSPLGCHSFLSALTSWFMLYYNFNFTCLFFKQDSDSQKWEKEAILISVSKPFLA